MNRDLTQPQAELRDSQLGKAGIAHSPVNTAVDDDQRTAPFDSLKDRRVVGNSKNGRAGRSEARSALSHEDFVKDAETTEAEQAATLAPTLILAGLGALAALTAIEIFQHLLRRFADEEVSLGVPIILGTLAALGITYVALRRQRALYRRTLEVVAERQRAEQQLRKSEERCRDLVENARDIIYSHDLKGNYTSVNKACEQITGYTIEEALTMNLADIIAPEYLGKARQMITRKLAGDKTTAYELEIIAKDGHRIAVEVNTRLVLQDGVPVGVQGIARDITERKHLEEQLRHSQKLDAIGQLAGGIAHDFNNLLTAITGYTELASRHLTAGHPALSNIVEIKKAADRATSLTRQLLAFSRRQVLQPRVLDLNSVVSEMEKMLRRLIGEDIELRTALNADLGKIKADRGQIEQVIVNLAVNARDAMPHGGKLTIETDHVHLNEDYARQHIDVSPGDYVMLVISDTGSGIDEQTQERIFDPFFTTKSIGKGTGLGLSTVYGIVKQSGGNISVYSEVGRGSAVKVYLPRLGKSAHEAGSGAGTKGSLKGTETILLVEDEEIVRKLARKVLDGYGYHVLEASDGESALSISGRYEAPIHQLLTDIIMPGMSGRELANRLGRLRPEMKVLFMSGYSDRAIVHQQVLDEGADFIQKPFTPDALARKIREVLDRG